MPPLDRLDPSSLQPFPPAASFEGLVADRLGQLAGSDAVMAGITATAGAHPQSDLDGLFDGTVRVGADGLGDEDASMPASQLPQFIDAGDNADVLRTGVLPYLPQPDAPIEQPFTDPPAAPSDIGEPGGVENPPPPQI